MGEEWSTWGNRVLLGRVESGLGCWGWEKSRRIKIYRKTYRRYILVTGGVFGNQIGRRPGMGQRRGSVTQSLDHPSAGRKPGPDIVPGIQCQRITPVTKNRRDIARARIDHPI